MITSFYDGRVRLRSAALKQKEARDSVIALLGQQQGVNNLTINPRTGSLLLEYDPAVISRDQLMLAAQAFQSEFEHAYIKPTNKKKHLSYRKAENYLLLGSYALCLGGLLLNSRAIHLAGGAVATLLLGKHLFTRRSSLLR